MRRKKPCSYETIEKAKAEFKGEVRKCPPGQPYAGYRGRKYAGVSNDVMQEFLRISGRAK